MYILLIHLNNGRPVENMFRVVMAVISLVTSVEGNLWVDNRSPTTPPDLDWSSPVNQLVSSLTTGPSRFSLKAPAWQATADTLSGVTWAVSNKNKTNSKTNSRNPTVVFSAENGVIYFLSFCAFTHLQEQLSRPSIETSNFVRVMTKGQFISGLSD